MANEELTQIDTYRDFIEKYEKYATDQKNTDDDFDLAKHKLLKNRIFNRLIIVKKEGKIKNCDALNG